MTRRNSVRQNKFKKVEKRSITKYILMAVAGILALSSVIMTVENASSGVEVASLREKQSQLSLEKRNLENTLVKSLSMSDLETKSTELGYIVPTSTVYVSGPKEAVAKLP